MKSSLRKRSVNTSFNGAKSDQETENVRKVDELNGLHDALDRERARFADLYDLAPISYLIVDHLGIIEDVNQTGVELLKLSKGSLRQKRFQNFVSPKDLDVFYEFLQRMRNSGGKVSTEVKLILPNKESLIARIEGIVISNPASMSVKYYITVIDTTEGRRAQELLKEANERLQMTLKASSTGIWSIEAESGNLMLDENSCKILDIDAAEFNDSLKGFFHLIHPKDRDKVRYSYRYSIKNAAELDLEFRVLTKKGVIKEISTKGQRIVVSEDHKPFAGIMTDITERKRLEKEAEKLKQTQQRTVLSATLNAQEQERAKISRALHDSVCQILYGIRLNIQSLTAFKENKESFRNVNALLDQAIKETRQISYELTPSVLKEFGFTAGIREMASRLSTQDFVVKATIKKTIDQIDKTTQLHAFRIIQELINNCIKHSQATVAEIFICGDGDLITMRVSDNGRGFEVGSTETLRKGSGLQGIKNQVFLLNGELTMNSNTKGTCVMISFNRNIELS